MNSSTTTNDLRSRQRLLEAAVQLLACEGLQPKLLERAAAGAGCSVDRARVFFRRDEEIVLALYARFAADLEAKVLELPAGTIAERFHAVMETKLALLAPFRAALAALTATVLDPRSELGPLHPQTEIIRRRVHGVFASVVHGASDGTGAPEALLRVLYAAHLALILLWCQDRTDDRQATTTAVGLARDLLSFVGPLLSQSEAGPTAQRLDSVFQPLLEPPEPAEITTRAAAILQRLYRHRRLSPNAGECATRPCPQCYALHLPRVKYFLLAGQPLHFVLPAFPAKSPSRRKTLGPMPDMAEQVALEYLDAVARELVELHSPGMRVTICSDGHVFSDLVGVHDDEVTRYGAAIRERIEALGCRTLETFDMSDLYETGDFAAMRLHLVQQYAQPLTEIEVNAHRFDHARAMFNGIHRFLFEEQSDVQTGISRTQLRERCKQSAYEVIQRSDAWSRLLADCFPTALRLSIHPQHPHAAKIGILLGKADDVWQTPWHGVALKTGSGWKLVKRGEAEGLRARLVAEGSADAHFEWP